MTQAVEKGQFVLTQDGRVARVLNVYTMGFASRKASLELPVGDGSLEHLHTKVQGLTPVYGPLGPFRKEDNHG